MYPNTEYLQSINMSKTEFERMCKMSSWATCSSSKKQAKQTLEEGEEEEEHANDEEDENADETTYVLFIKMTMVAWTD
jgi:tRNA:m4X modification enzyme